MNNTTIDPHINTMCCVCPKCHGEGSVSTSETHGHLIDCDICHARGWVPCDARHMNYEPPSHQKSDKGP